MLLLPVYLLDLGHFTVLDARGTGFLQYDQASYMSEARAYFASGHLSLTYGLPFSPDPATPKLFFQPLTLALGLAWKSTESDPGTLYLVAGLLLALVCARVVIALYDQVVGCTRPGAGLGLLCFFWGGGALTLSGLIYGRVLGKPPLAHMLDFDPVQGFWFLNLGRNLIFTTEAFYHLIFFGSIVLVLRGRFAAAFVGAMLLSASHPFSGLQLIAVLGTWSITEHVIRSADRPPLLFPLMLFVLAALHVGYYLWLLNFVSDEYRVLRQQWSQPWALPASSMLAAYGPAAAFAAAAVIARWSPSRSLDRTHRLLLSWFVVSLALAKHDLLITPIQPLHFTRGYIWTPLFLLGAPALLRAFEATLQITVARFVVPGALAGLLLLDNAAWFLWVVAHEHYGARPFGLTLEPQQRMVIRAFQDRRYAGYLVVSENPELGYLATVYSPLRSWYSHEYSTPHAALRRAQVTAFFADGAEPAEWRDRPLLVVSDRPTFRAILQLKEAGFRDVLDNDFYTVLSRRPETVGSISGTP